MNANLKPISLGTAARILEQRYPKWAFDRLALRRMCIDGKIPCMLIPMTSVRPAQNYRVRLAELLEVFQSWERKKLEWK